MGDHVPKEFKKRNDFVTPSEMQEACNEIGGRYGFDLKNFNLYYSAKV